MPTYQYECDACGHGFEEFQSMTAAKLRKCPKCGKNKLQRLIGTGTGIIFKGTGFYQTDYKNKGSSTKSTKDTDKATETKKNSGCGCGANKCSSHGG